MRIQELDYPWVDWTTKASYYVSFVGRQRSSDNEKSDQTKETNKQTNKQTDKQTNTSAAKAKTRTRALTNYLPINLSITPNSDLYLKAIS